MSTTRASDLGLSPADHPEHWERYYAQVGEAERMPWYCAGLDPDVERALDAHRIAPGARVLDVGTGPANHAFELARRGFRVTGIDLSPSVIERARAAARELGLDVSLAAVDVLTGAIVGGPFDVALDRGCFHCLFSRVRDGYAARIDELLAPGGRLLLKTFSHEDEGTGGPHRFHPDELDAVFGGRFERLELTKTIYQGTMPEKPKALFTVWRKTA